MSSFFEPAQQLCQDLSAREYDRILKVSRTTTDLPGSRESARREWPARLVVSSPIRVKS